MKISGWEKLHGITYKGYSILNPIHNAINTQYIADVMDLTTKNKLYMLLDLDSTYNDFGSIRHYALILEDKLNKVKVQRIINYDMLQSMSTFRQIYELCIEDYIKEVEETWTKQNGILNVVANSGATHSWSQNMPTFDEFIKNWKTT